MTDVAQPTTVIPLGRGAQAELHQLGGPWMQSTFDAPQQWRYVITDAEGGAVAIDIDQLKILILHYLTLRPPT